VNYRPIAILFWPLLFIGFAAFGQDNTVSNVGEKVCAECHSREFDLWRSPHHELAMHEANDGSVLGDFDDATLTRFGIETRFYRDGDRFMVHTEGPRGDMHDFEFAYTFGVAPLQQCPRGADADLTA